MWHKDRSSPSMKTVHCKNGRCCWNPAFPCRIVHPLQSQLSSGHQRIQDKTAKTATLSMGPHKRLNAQKRVEHKVPVSSSQKSETPVAKLAQSTSPRRQLASLLGCDHHAAACCRLLRVVCSRRRSAGSPCPLSVWLDPCSHVRPVHIMLRVFGRLQVVLQQGSRAGTTGAMPLAPYGFSVLSKGVEFRGCLGD